MERCRTASYGRNSVPIDEEQLSQLPMRLVRQAGNIAQRVLKEIIYANEK